jgi:hypothetical protein
LIIQTLKSRPWLEIVLCCSLLVATVSCASKSRPEKWIIPENYTGWLRLDYAITGAPSLPMEGGAYLVRIPQSGRLETSSPYNPSVDKNEFFVTTDHGLQKLGFSQEMMAHSQPAIEEYAVQNAFGFFEVAKNTVQRPGKCVFVGTDPAFRDNGRDCESWESGQSEPPKFKKHFVLHKPTDRSKN